MRKSKTTQHKPHVVIIGAGIGSLAASALLAKDGYRVTVLEKNEQPGGRSSLLVDRGFRFDMGPSWYLMPEVFERYFAHFGKDPKTLLDLQAPDPQYRIFFHDKTHVDIVRNLDKNCELFESIEEGAGHMLRAYLADSERKYEASLAHFLYRNMDSVFDLLNVDLMRKGFSLDVFGTMDRHVGRYFESEKLKQIIEYTLVFLGGAPSNTPALFSLMSHLDFNQGVLYPKGGFYKVVEALYQNAIEQWVTFHFNTPVSKILTDKRRIVGVQTNTGIIEADVLISNADYVHTEDLLDNARLRTYDHAYWSKKLPAPSAFLMYLGIQGKLPSLRHHTLYFGKNWIEHFESIFGVKPYWPKNPSLYINAPSVSDHTVAPEGCENLMILVPVAAGLSDGSKWKKHYADFILDYIEKNMNIRLHERILTQKIFSVDDFTDRYNSWRGNALGGLAHTLWQSALWRPKNKSAHLKNLFFVGANTNPGIGVPPAIISAELVRQRVNTLLQ